MHWMDFIFCLDAFFYRQYIVASIFSERFLQHNMHKHKNIDIVADSRVRSTACSMTQASGAEISSNRYGFGNCDSTTNKATVVL